MELKLGVVIPGNFQHPVAFGKKYGVIFLVVSDGVPFAAKKLFKHLFVVTGNPECLVEAQGSKVTLGAVFMFQAEFDDIELQLSNSTDNFAGFHAG